MDQLKPLIDQLVKAIQGTVDIVNGQMPDIAKQIVRYYLWANVVEISILIGIMIVGIYGFVYCQKRASVTSENRWDNDHKFWYVGFVPLAGLEILSFCTAWSYLDTMLKAILAPKILVIETLRSYLH